MLKKIGVISALLIASMPINAENVNSDTDIYIMTRSYHYQDNNKYNNNNIGAYVQHKGYIGGFYKNSFSNWVGLLGMEVSEIYRHENFRVTATAGAAVGYEHSPIIPSVGINIDSEFVRLTVTPVVANLNFKVASW